jgi:hypothetical protein
MWTLFPPFACSVLSHRCIGLATCSLQIDNPEQYNFRPKWLLVQICTIYLHMSAADRGGKFAAAIAADKRSYRPEMFAEASMILRQLGLMPELQVRGAAVTSDALLVPRGLCAMLSNAAHA